ncbi:MAG: hypothetical protein K8T90_07145 [Planctomycetes bacterium]|nr:hypothetical protein [Planctomycetota bacterium]
MSHTITVTEMARRFADYLNRVAYRGEHFVLVRGSKPIAELRPLPSGRRLSDLPAMLASLPHLAPGDAERFGDDVDMARGELATTPVRDPWQS